MNQKNYSVESKKVNRFIEYVAEKLINQYDVSPREVMDYITDSSFMETLNEDPEYVFHYSSHYWAKYIIDEHLLFLEPVY
ncbi:hypothetical protein P4K71_24455 [Bacillus cereus]|uniref:hypothetical protein n=1 Tax=Bacillus cereus group TaxID=86661 RepID=UPI000A371E8D|nr:hypothetical protein [Bacillus thuringiensis]MEB8740792.1 hypothetical protein [Bacillus cereus]MEB8909440.1 hypothetical protein [Bacillus cereus]MEB9925903.1 hypothetical protein [Bacillus cereus]MEB9986871.1 hypothetical protein [Bacillus cereus]MEB9991972.1 hypothetical protein [Bacillus cereus]